MSKYMHKSSKPTLIDYLLNVTYNKVIIKVLIIIQSFLSLFIPNLKKKREEKIKEKKSGEKKKRGNNRSKN